MKNLFSTLTLVGALGLAGGAQAALITFDTPAVFEIDNATQVATYTVEMFKFSGIAGSFLQQDTAGRGGTGGLFVTMNSVLSLTSADGGLFNLTSFDHSTLGGLIATPATSLLVEGFFGNNTMLSQMLDLGMLKSFSFVGWTGLALVKFSADGEFVLDNLAVNALQVPEPASWALVGLALAGLGWRNRRRAEAEPLTR